MKPLIEIIRCNHCAIQSLLSTTFLPANERSKSVVGNLRRTSAVNVFSVGLLEEHQRNGKEGGGACKLF